MVNTNISVIADNAVIIECPITGTPQPDIIWYKEGVRLHPEKEVSFIFIITALLKCVECHVSLTSTFIGARIHSLRYKHAIIRIVF